MRNAARSLREENVREIHICVCSAPNTALYIRYLLAFFALYPQFSLSLHEYDAREARKAFRNGDLDMMIDYTGSFEELLGADDAGDLSVLLLQEEELFYAGTGQSGRTHISLAQALDDRLIVHQNTAAGIMGMIARFGIDLNCVHPIVTTTSMDVLKAYLLSGTARSLISQSALSALNLEGRVELIPIDERPTLSLGLLSNPGKLSGAGRELLAYMKERCGGE